jgi:hypothetical protein
MTPSFPLTRRLSRLRGLLTLALLLALFGCNDAGSFNADGSMPETADPTGLTNDEDPLILQEEEGTAVTPVTSPDMAVSFAGGIPIGTFAQPTSEFGSRYNGAMRNISPNALRSELSAIKSRGGRIVLMMAGPQDYYKNADGTFSITKWKARIDRYRNVDFAGYVSDGTIIAHYLIDEPYDPANWSGKPVTGSTIEEMARYSKQLWPSLATVVRAEPGRIKWSGTYRYLDAAWAQYLWRKGDVRDFIDENVRDAQNMGLGLIVGLNLRHGGNPNKTSMSASEVESWGSTLLSSSYPCAFVSWQYMSDYLSTSSMKSAMDALRRKAESRSLRSCRT